MSYKVEKLEKNMAVLTIESSAEDFNAAIVKAYNKNKSKMNVPGFRKGKAPLAMIEKIYGVEVFYEDAANALIPDAYADAADNCGLEIVSRPEISVTQMKKGEPFIFTAKVAVKPEVVLGEYKGVEVEKVDTKVTEAEVEAEVKKALEQNAKHVEVTDRAVENGDETTIDFEGFVDGVAFEGGKGTDYPLTIGSGAFIPGFEDQIIGKNIGEEFDVNVTFPTEYHNADLAGKASTFKCTVKSIKVKVVEEASDAFAAEVSEFETLKEYKDDIKKNLKASKEKHAKVVREDDAVRKAAENASIEIPQAMIDAQKEQMAEEFAYQLRGQGLDIKEYLQYTGMDEKSFFESMEPQAVTRIRTRLTLEAIVAAENIVATDDDFEQEMANMAKQYNMEVDKVKEVLGNQKDTIMMDIAVRKAAEFLGENAKGVAKKATKKAAKEDAAETTAE